MDHEADPRVVVAHPECSGGHEHLEGALEEQALRLLLLLQLNSPVVPTSIDPLLLQPCCDDLNIVGGQAIDDP